MTPIQALILNDNFGAWSNNNLGLQGSSSYLHTKQVVYSAVCSVNIHKFSTGRLIKVISTHCIGLEQRWKQNAPDSVKIGVKCQIIHINVSVRGISCMTDARMGIKMVRTKIIKCPNNAHWAKAYVGCHTQIPSNFKRSFCMLEVRFICEWDKNIWQFLNTHLWCLLYV